MEKFEIYNQISREVVKNYNTYLHPEDVKILPTLETPPHYTISHVLDAKLALQLHEITKKLKSIDSSLIINEPSNYHITLFWKGLDSKLEDKSESIKRIIEKYEFDFDVEELLFGPLGISVKFYPKSDAFVDARTELYKLTETPISIDERFVTTWVSLAAYSQVPTSDVKKFVVENSNIKFGSCKVSDFTLYISNNKGLVNPQKVIEYKCGK